MVESHRRPITAHFWRFAFWISKNYQLTTINQSRRFVDIYIQSLGTRTLRLRFVLDLSFPITAVSRLHEKQQRIGKVKDQAERVISTPELNMLPCLHPEPINVVVYHDPSGRSHLGIGLALRCFKRLSLPNIATQHCR